MLINRNELFDLFIFACQFGKLAFPVPSSPKTCSRTFRSTRTLLQRIYNNLLGAVIGTLLLGNLLGAVIGTLLLSNLLGAIIGTLLLGNTFPSYIYIIFILSFILKSLNIFYCNVYCIIIAIICYHFCLYFCKRKQNHPIMLK